MDPLSDVLSLLKPESVGAGGFAADGDLAIQFPKHAGIKCYAVLSGECWLSVEGAVDDLRLVGGDCFLLTRGLPFSLKTEPSLTPVDFRTFLETRKETMLAPREEGSGRYIVGGHFVLSGGHADILLKSLPPIVHIHRESDKAAMRWSLERLRAELRDPQPGGSLMAQQLAYMMLVQALRLHLSDGSRSGGWLSALADPQMRAALACMHDEPGQPWTLQALAERVGMSRSVFALRFKQVADATPMEYLTRWRMLLAGRRLEETEDSIACIASSLGYDSESAFGKAFRRVMGCSPRKYGRNGSHQALQSRGLAT